MHFVRNPHLVPLNLRPVARMFRLPDGHTIMITYDILWMEEILHQLVDGVSHYNNIIYIYCVSYSYH